MRTNKIINLGNATFDDVLGDIWQYLGCEGLDYEDVEIFFERVGGCAYAVLVVDRSVGVYEFTNIEKMCKNCDCYEGVQVQKLQK